MKKKKATLEGLNNLLPHLSRQRGWEEQLDLHTVFVNWDALLDQDTVDHCQPLKIVKKVLWVEVENSAWLQQLQFQTVQLLAILNQSLKKSQLLGLRFCVAEQRQGKKMRSPSCFVMSHRLERNWLPLNSRLNLLQTRRQEML